MKSVCTVDLLKPSSLELLVARVVAARHSLEDSRAVGDVARRVLVEERVQEDEPGSADPRVAVDEGDLAEHRGAVVGAHLLADDVDPELASTVDDAAALEAQLEIADDRAAEGERHRRAHGALGAAAVGGREDLLGRHVDDVATAVHGLLGRRAPACARSQADRQVGAGPAEAQRVEAPLVQQ